MSNPETPQFEGIIGSVVGESGYLSQCLCGKQFEPWDTILSIYPDMPTEMHCCGRKLYLKIETTVLEAP